MFDNGIYIEPEDVQLSADGGQRAEVCASKALHCLLGKLKHVKGSDAGLLLATTRSIATVLEEMTGRASGDETGERAVERWEEAIAQALLEERLPRSVRCVVADLFGAIIDLRVARPVNKRRALIEAVLIPSSLLYNLRRHLFPPERMVVGAVRRMDDACVVETYYDVTGRANAGHVDADPLKLTEALVDMDESPAPGGSSDRRE